MVNIILDKTVAIKDDEKLQNDDFGNNMEIQSQVIGSSSPMLKGKRADEFDGKIEYSTFYFH